MRQAHEEAASAIEAFVDGRGKTWDWDDYVSVAQDDPFLESIRLRCSNMPIDYPPKENGHYCSPAGIDILRSQAREIRDHLKTFPDESHLSAQPTRPTCG